MESLVELAKQAGPWAFAIILLLIGLKTAHSERRELQKENAELTERVLKGLNDSANALKDIRRLFRVSAERSGESE